MDIRQLRYVVAIAEAGSFTRAAERLGIAQPSLSQAVRALENELGTELFVRSGRRVTPTAAGEAILAPARQAQRDLETARAAVDAVRGVGAGTLEIVTLPTLAADPSAELVGRFRRAHGGVRVRMREPDDDASVTDLVRSGTCEIGVADLPLADPGGLASRELAEQEYRVVLPAGGVSRSSRRSLAELADVPLVTTPVGTSTRRVVDAAFVAVGVRPSIAVETEHREALIPLVLAGAGATLVPETLAEDARARGARTAALDPPVTRRIGIIHREGPISPAAAAFLEVALPGAGPAARRPRARRR